MPTLKTLCFLLLMAAAQFAFAQPDSLDLDLGGESTGTSGIPDAVPQIIRKDIWLRSMLDLDSLRVGNPYMIVDERNNRRHYI